MSSPFFIGVVTTQPWSNGLGLTRVLAKGDGWRISVAEVSSDGPFSRFDGVFRQALIINGRGCKLTTDDRSVVLVPHCLSSFDGGEDWFCKLEDQAITIVNVMTNGDSAIAKVFQAEHLEIESQETTFLLAVNCSAHYVFDSVSNRLDAGYAVLLPAGRLKAIVDTHFAHSSSYLLVVQIRKNVTFT